MPPADRPPFEHELTLDAPPDAVWRALAEEAGVAGWFAPEAEIEPRPGGRLVWRWPGLHEWAQRVEVWEPGARLVTSYPSGVAGPDGAPRPLRVELTIQGAAGRTTLRLVHSGFGPEADFDEEYQGISRGWPIELESLRLYVERHRAARRHLAWSTRAVGADLDAAWQRLVGPDGLDLGDRPDRRAPGAELAVALEGDAPVAARVLTTLPREVSACVPSRGDAFLRVAVERCPDPTAWLWLARWERPGEDGARLAAEQAALQARWEERLAALFAGAASARGERSA